MGALHSITFNKSALMASTLRTVFHEIFQKAIASAFRKNSDFWFKRYSTCRELPCRTVHI